MTPEQLAQAIHTVLTDAVAAGELAVALPAVERLRVERPKNRDHGDWSSNVALQLAKGKALSGRGDDWSIGSDSVLEVEGIRYSKPRDRDEAADHLRRFSGRTMRLSSAVALAKDGRIDWTRPADQVHDLVRAVTHPYPGAFTDVFGGKTIVWKTRVPHLGAHDNFPGQVRTEQGRLYVACGDDRYLEVLRIQREGQNEIDGRHFSSEAVSS